MKKEKNYKLEQAIVVFSSVFLFFDIIDAEFLKKAVGHVLLILLAMLFYKLRPGNDL